MAFEPRSFVVVVVSVTLVTVVVVVVVVSSVVTTFGGIVDISPSLPSLIGPTRKATHVQWPR